MTLYFVGTLQHLLNILAEDRGKQLQDFDNYSLYRNTTPQKEAQKRSKKYRKLTHRNGNLFPDKKRIQKRIERFPKIKRPSYSYDSFEVVIVVTNSNLKSHTASRMKTCDLVKGNIITFKTALFLVTNLRKTIEMINKAIVSMTVIKKYRYVKEMRQILGVNWRTVIGRSSAREKKRQRVITVQYINVKTMSIRFQ